MQNEIDNMKKIILIPIFFLFLIPLITAHDFNFTTHYDITTSAQTGQFGSRIKAFNHNETYWYVIYQQELFTSATNYNIKLERLDVDDWTNLETSQFGCCENCVGADLNKCYYTDCSYRYRIAGDTFACISSSRDHNAKRNTIIQEIYLDNQSRVVINETYNARYGDKFASCQFQPLKLWQKDSGENDLRYTEDGFVGTGTGLPDGDGVWDLPAIYENPDDIQVVLCGGAYHVIINNAGTVRDLIYSFGRDYKGVVGLGLPDWEVQDYDYGVWQQNNILYIAQVNNSKGNDGIPRIALLGYSCDSDYQLSQVFYKEYNQTVINSTANYTANRTINKPFLMKDRNDIFHLFYEWRDGTDYQIKVAVDYADCICSEWMAQDECVEGNQKYNRTCNPYGCDSNTTYWSETTYCGREFNRTVGIYPQEYRRWTSQTSCESDWFDVGEGIAECSPNPIKIPVECINISVTEEANPEFDTYAVYLGCPKGRFDLTVCNPTHRCFNTSYSCSQLNVTSTLSADNTNYYAGDYATGYSSLYVETACKCKSTIWNFGIQKFKLHESLTVACNIGCKREWYCLNDDYKTLRHEDCSQSNTTFCSYGCLNGDCLGVGQGFKTPVSPDWWVNFFTNPTTPSNKFILGIVGSISIGSIGLYFANGTKHSFIFFLFLFAVGWAFFTVTGFIPAIISIIIVFFVGGYFLLSKLKG